VKQLSAHSGGTPPLAGVVDAGEGFRRACSGHARCSSPRMPRYSNLSRHSGVVAYETADDWIALTFVNGERYLYGPTRPGREAVERMKSLARAGRGLSTFVSQHVRDHYERKL
jgi:hypothetical protein